MYQTVTTSISLAVLAVLGAAIYSNVLHGPFVLDDLWIMEEVGERNYFEAKELVNSRSVSMVTLAVNRALSGEKTTSYHVVNILIHIINAWLVFGITWLLTKRQLSAGTTWGVAFVVALLFVAHPIQTEAVSYIVQRITSIATLFYLLSLFLYLRWRESNTRLAPYYFAACVVALMLAMYSKEIAFTAPVSIVLVECLFFSRSRRKLIERWPYLVVIVATMAIIPLARIGGIPFMQFNPFDKPFAHLASLPSQLAGAATDETTTLSRSTYLFTQLPVMMTYLRLLVWPTNQSVEYDVPLYHSLFALPVAAAAAVIIAVVAGGVWLLWRGYVVPGFGILFFFITLSIESSIFPIKDLVYEHRLYLPSVGFFLFVVTGAVAMADTLSWPVVEKRRIMTMAAVVAVAVFSLATFRRNVVWQDTISFWQDAAQKAPNKARPHSNVGAMYASQGKFDQAIAEYERTLALDPAYVEAHNNLGSIYAQLGRTVEAERSIKKALELNPQSSSAYNNLGSLYAQQHRTDEAIATYRQGIFIDPYNIDLHANIARVYAGAAQLNRARAEFELALLYAPRNVIVLTDLGATYYNQGNSQKAKELFEQALAIDPTYHRAAEFLQILN